MVRRLKQTKQRDVHSSYRDNDNILYQIYMGYYIYYFDATSHIGMTPRGVFPNPNPNCALLPVHVYVNEQKSHSYTSVHPSD